jgi:hypothetical protein
MSVTRDAKTSSAETALGVAEADSRARSTAALARSAIRGDHAAARSQLTRKPLRTRGSALIIRHIFPKGASVTGRACGR